MADDTSTSKLIEVLGRIDTTLAALDRRLQAPEQHSLQPTPAAGANSTASPSNRVKTRRQGPLTLTYEADDGQSGPLREFTIKYSNLLYLLEQIGSTCLNRRYHGCLNLPRHKTFGYPFTELLPYRGILNLLASKSGPPDNELGIFIDVPVTSELRDNIRALLDCFDQPFVSWALEFENWGVAKGVISFEELPAVFGPGTLHLATENHFAGQVVEVSSCEIVATSGGPESCVVDVWYFRWDGQAFARTSFRFQLDRYRGKQPIRWLPFRPLLELGLDDPTLKLDSLLLRNKENLEVLGSYFAKVEPGDYPLCFWHSEKFKSATLVRIMGKSHSVGSPLDF